MPDIVANVPMIVFGFGKGRQIVDTLRSNSSAKNNTSHFDVFSTILTLMGYDTDKIKKTYGQSLFDYRTKDNKRTYLGNSIKKGDRAIVKVFGSSSNQ